MAYIVVLNPLILSSGVDSVGGKLPIAALAAGTARAAVLMGVVARLFVLDFLRWPLLSLVS